MRAHELSDKLRKLMALEGMGWRPITVGGKEIQDIAWDADAEEFVIRADNYDGTIVKGRE